MTRTFTIEGEPQGKGRPRFARMGKFTRAYTPKKTHDYEQMIQLEFGRQVGDKVDKGVPLRVCIAAYYGIPKSASKKKQEAMQNGLIRPLKKVDIDNLVKVILDALNGIAWHDDVQVVEVYATKWYSDQPRVEVTIFEA